MDNKILISEINNLAKENAGELVALAEQKYISSCQFVAKEIKDRGIKIVLISGPSSAGKTTSSFRLQEQLSLINVPSHVLNMDNFFIDMDKLPLRADGEPNIEDLCALDVECIRRCLGEILLTNKTKTPEFDFVTHSRKKDWIDCVLEGNEVIIMEGIHAHNPAIVEGLDRKLIYKVYLDCESSFVVGKQTLNSREIRLIRRMIRDERDRKVPYLLTVQMWDEVCIGEDKNIKPFKFDADYVIDTVHSYELLLYKFVIRDKLLKYSKDKEVAKLLKIFNKCLEIDKTLIPKSSLIREFVGK